MRYSGLLMKTQLIVAFGMASARHVKFTGFASQLQASFIGVFRKDGGNSTVKWPRRSAVKAKIPLKLCVYTLL